MRQEFFTLEINTNGQKLYEFTEKTIQWIKKLKINNGLLNLSIQHTSASIIVQENADDYVKEDLISFFNKIIPKDTLFKHNYEGDDDMPAHIKSSLNKTSCTFSVLKKKLKIGIWQGIFLFEHRYKSQTRKINLHFLGE